MRKNDMTLDDMLTQRRKLRKYTPKKKFSEKKAAFGSSNILNRARILADYGVNIDKYNLKRSND